MHFSICPKHSLDGDLYLQYLMLDKERLLHEDLCPWGAPTPRRLTDGEGRGGGGRGGEEGQGRGGGDGQGGHGDGGWR